MRRMWNSLNHWVSGRLTGWPRPTELRWIGSWIPTTTVLAKSTGPTGKTWVQMGLRPRAVPPKRMRMASQKPVYGAGKLGVGPPLKVVLSGKPRFSSDGHGLASPGRWSFGQRPCGSFDGELQLHHDIVQDLLQLLSSKLDVKLELCKLATGRAQCSPFPPELVSAGRDLLFNRLREAGSAAELDKVAERQPFYLEAVSELLRLAGDPDWRRYTTSTWSFSKGVPLGVDVRLPRTPALFPRKCKHRIYPEADVFDGELRDNYSSARESAEQIERQFQQEIELGAMVRYDLDQARAEFGDELVVASLGAVPKADQSVRVVHDATHGLHVNDRIRVRDAQTYPTGADLRVALEQLPGAYFSLSGDIARAHRLVKVRRQDWARQARRAAATSMIFLNTVGTFGLASASYWWFRLMSGLGRLLCYCHGRDATTLLSYVDDLIWLTQSPFGLIRVLASVFLLEILGMPFWGCLLPGRNSAEALNIRG